MNSLHYFPTLATSRSSAFPLHNFKSNLYDGRRTRPSSSPPVTALGVTSSIDRRRSSSLKAVSGSTSSAESKEIKSDTYSQDMTAAMGADLTYRHELGMNYTFINPDLIVGSCLQTPEDVDKLNNIGVKTVFCLQQDPDLHAGWSRGGCSYEMKELPNPRKETMMKCITEAYFGVDISAIREYAKKIDGIEHLRAEIRDFDAFDLRMRLPAVVSKLYKAINRNGGVTYVHCTAGLGRAPAVAVAYMFWVQGYKLGEALKLLQSKRPSFPKMDAIKSATADIVTGHMKKNVTLTWKDNSCSTVEVSGLDIGWGQRMPLTFDKEQGFWVLKRDLPGGRFEYKYIVDGVWMCNKHEPSTSPNRDGYVNNYVQVVDDDHDADRVDLQKRLAGDNPDLTKDERVKIRKFLEAYPEVE